MNKYDRCYNEMQNLNSENNNIIAREILEEFAFKFGLDFIYQIPGTWLNKFFVMLTSEYSILLNDYIKITEYSFSPELSYLLANFCYGNINDNFMNLPSVNNFVCLKDSILLDSIVGKIRIYKATDLYKNLETFTVYGRCHLACHSFINIKKDATAVTSLIPMPFMGKQYHSYIETDDTILDLAHNCVLSKKDHDLIFQPEVLNKVKGFELDKEEERINNKESLSNGKELLLRLALDKQL